MPINKPPIPLVPIIIGPGQPPPTQVGPPDPPPTTPTPEPEPEPFPSSYYQAVRDGLRRFLHDHRLETPTDQVAVIEHAILDLAPLAHPPANADANAEANADPLAGKLS